MHRSRPHSPPSAARLLNRRRLLRYGGGLGLAGVLAGFSALGRAATAAAQPPIATFGALRNTPDRTTGLSLLRLPQGFEYASFGWRDSPMADGLKTPGNHDGMGVVRVRDGIATLVRNHEIGPGRALANPAYDTDHGGCTTTLRFDTRSGEWLDARLSLAGTSRNCSGGVTPWETWLSCEETLAGPESRSATETHGWVFEVPPDGMADPVPLPALGRFNHEAVAADTASGMLFMTEDRITSGFYRFTPRSPGRLIDGGRLEMLRVPSQPYFDTATRLRPGETVAVDWVPIEAPEQAFGQRDGEGLGVYLQGLRQGGATFRRGEGAHCADGVVMFNCTTGGRAERGQVFALDVARNELTLVFESPGAVIADHPDNIAVSPRGAAVLCEDGGSGTARLLCLDRNGFVSTFAENTVILTGEMGFTGNYSRTEWCGACFHEDWLFVNLQNPGITFAITGPWREGLL